MSPTYREGDGVRKVGPTWESLIERQIREAMEAGAFEALPHQGEPLPKDDDAGAGEWAMAHRMLRNAGVAPPWIEADKDARARLAELEIALARTSAIPPGPRRDRARRDLAARVAAVNAAVERLNAEAPTERQHRRLVDLDAVLARLDEGA